MYDEEVVEETFDSDGKLVSRKTTKISRPTPYAVKPIWPSPYWWVQPSQGQWTVSSETNPKGTLRG